MSIQKNVKTTFGIATLLLVASVAGLVATKSVEVDQPAMKPQAKPQAPRTYMIDGNPSSTPHFISQPN
ncbi:TPA: hypothetical protein NIA45_006752 [Pseudomonas aeruginosa]|nr:hypothetical protein [Pseudomonas aeruginosa]